MDWKNVGIIVVPVATALLTSGFFLQHITNIIEQQTQPDLKFTVKSTPQNLSSDIDTLRTEIRNDGESSAKNLKIIMAYPIASQDSNIKVINVTSSLLNVESITNSSFNPMRKVFEADVERLSAGATIRLVTNVTTPFGTDLENIPCIIILAYDWQSDNRIESASREGLCNQSALVSDPYLSAQSIIIISIIAVCAIFLIIIKRLPLKITQMVNNKKFVEYLRAILTRAIKICEELEKYPDSRVFFSDKAWKSIPLESRNEIIRDSNRYAKLNSFFILVRERNDILTSLSLSGTNLSKQFLSRDLTELLKNYNSQIFSIGKEIIDFDWNKYSPHMDTQTPYPSYLIFPLLILFTLAMTYLIESVLYHIIVGVSFDTFINTWIYFLEKPTDAAGINNVLIFFLISFSIRSIIAFFMLRFILVKFNPIFGSFDNKFSFNNTRINNKKLIICSICIIGLPSLPLVLTIITFGIDKFYLEDPNILIVIAVSIAIFDVLRLILALLILRTTNTVKVLYFFAAGLTAFSGLLYMSMAIITTEEFVTTSSIIIIFIGIIQIAVSLPMLKQRWCFVGMISHLALSVIWLILLANLPIYLFMFQEMNVINYSLSEDDIINDFAYFILLVQVIYIFLTSSIIIYTRKMKTSKKCMDTLDG